METLRSALESNSLSSCWWRTEGECINNTNDIILICLYLPSSSSQGSVLQLCASKLSPAQHWPPFAGEGLVQVLLRSFIPPPHGTLHSLQSPNSLHPPCTANELRPERQLFRWSGKVLYLNTDLVDHNSSIALWSGFIDWLIDWLSDWPTEWLTDWPTDWLTEWMNDCLTEWLTDGLTDWLADWLTDCLSVCLTDWLTDCLSVFLTDWMNDWLADWLTTDWLTEWLTEWLTDCLNNWRTGWLTDWRNDWLTDRPTDRLIGSLTGSLVDWN